MMTDRRHCVTLHGLAGSGGKKIEEQPHAKNKKMKDSPMQRTSG
jgi:hypothetical protein